MAIEIGTSDNVAVTLLALGIFLVPFGLVSRFLKRRLYLSEPLLATAFGVIFGPKCLGFLKILDSDWTNHGPSRETFAWICRLCIGIQVLFAGSMLPNRYLGRRENQTSIAILLLPVMLAGLAITSVIIKLSIPGLSITEAIMLGGTLTPTDPVLANSVVKGSFAERFVPSPIRDALISESAINDGFGTPFVYLPLCFIIHHNDTGASLRDFFLRIVLWNVIFGTALGCLIGYLSSVLLVCSKLKDWINHENFTIFGVSLALMTLGVGRLLDSNELLACYFAGSALSWTTKLPSDGFHSSFTDGVEMLFDTGVFIMLGATLPWDSWRNGSLLSPSKLVLVGSTTLLFKRIPCVLFLYRIIPVISNFKEAVFFGHFGPIGVGAIYYSLIATGEIDENQKNRWAVVPIVLFVVLCSVIIHGLSTPIIMLWQARSTRFKASDLEDNNSAQVHPNSLVDTPDQEFPGRPQPEHSEPMK